MRIVIDGKTYEADEEGLRALDRDGVKYAPAASLERTEPITETIGDTLRGAAHGATWGLADAKFGESNQSLPERLGMASYDEVKTRSPTAATVGDIGGSLASSTLVPMGGLGRAGRIAADLGMAAAESGVRAKAEGASTDEALMDAGIGAGFSGLASAATGAVGRGVGKLGEAFGQQASKARARSVGILSKESSKLRELGFDSIEDAAKFIERVSPSKAWHGSSAADRFERAAENIEVGGVGRGVDDALREANLPSGDVQQSWLDALGAMQRQAADATSATASERSYKSALGRNVAELGAEAPPLNAVEMRQQATRFGKDARNGGLIASDKAASQASLDMERAVRDDLANAVSRSADPEALARFRAANSAYSDEALVRDLAKKRADVEATDTWLPAAAASGAGALAAGLTADEGEGLDRAFQGAVAAGVLGTRSQAVQALGKSKGLDALANIARYLESKLGGATGGITPEVLQRMAANFASKNRSDDDTRPPEQRFAGAGSSWYW